MMCQQRLVGCYHGCRATALFPQVRARPRHVRQSFPHDIDIISRRQFGSIFMPRDTIISKPRSASRLRDSNNVKTTWRRCLQVAGAMGQLTGNFAANNTKTGNGNTQRGAFDGDISRDITSDRTSEANVAGDRRIYKPPFSQPTIRAISVRRCISQSSDNRATAIACLDQPGACPPRSGRVAATATSRTRSTYPQQWMHTHRRPIRQQIDKDQSGSS